MTLLTLSTFSNIVLRTDGIIFIAEISTNSNRVKQFFPPLYHTIWYFYRFSADVRVGVLISNQQLLMPPLFVAILFAVTSLHKKHTIQILNVQHWLDIIFSLTVLLLTAAGLFIFSPQSMGIYSLIQLVLRFD